MKRILFLMLTLMLALCMLTSCIIIPLYRHFRIDIYEVESIEIYDLPEKETYNYQSGFEERLSPIYTLSGKQKNAFLSDLGEIQFKDAIVIVLAAIDRSARYNRWSIKINYTSGSYDTYGYLYNSSQSQLSSNDDDGDGSNFKITRSMLVGETVYLKVKLYSSSSTGTFTVTVS